MGVTLELGGVKVYLATVIIKLAGAIIELAGVTLELRGVKVFLATVIIKLAGAIIELAGKKVKLATADLNVNRPNCIDR